jgi:hypothetical protein
MSVRDIFYANSHMFSDNVSKLSLFTGLIVFPKQYNPNKFDEFILYKS